MKRRMSGLEEETSMNATYKGNYFTLSKLDCTPTEKRNIKQWKYISDWQKVAGLSLNYSAAYEHGLLPGNRWSGMKNV